MEEEAREILRSGVSAEPVPTINLAESIRRHFDHLGGVELVIAPREAVRRPPRIAE